MLMRTASLLLLLLTVGSASAQSSSIDPSEGFTCKNHDPVEMERFRTTNPQGWQRAIQAREELDARTAAFDPEQARGGGGSYIIPVVFHIIHDDGQENISDEQVRDAIRVLNNDYNKLNADWVTVRPEFLDLVSDVGIEFRLAQRDPQGNCTNGITRTRSDLTYEGDYGMTQLIQWPRNRYMNIWVGASASGAAGYTNYPWVLDGSPESDGIVVKHDYVGSIGTSSTGRSRVLTHEVGHWLNLPHCWGNSNEPGLEENCSMDDGVADTPLTQGWTSCILSGATCGSPLDNVENYMEYSYCAKMFTIGQGTRMIAALTSSIAQRSSLWQPTNLAFTGVLEEPILCQARLRANDREVCAGSTVTFQDESFNNVIARNWEFPGGEPSTSTDQQPQVTYSQPGVYPVTLTVSDGSMALTAEEEAYIVVLPDTGPSWPLVDSFEGISALTSPEWTVDDPDGNGGFTLTGAAAYTGSNAIRLANSGALAGSVDAVVSSTLDATGLSSMTIGFRYAFARRQSWNDDVLRMYVSTNCGATWSPRKTLRGSIDLATAPNQTSVFVPTSAQWAYAEASSFGPSTFVPNLRIKFEFTSDGGNHLYIDDINVDGVPLTTGITSVQGGQAVRITPNPTSDRIRVSLDPKSTWPHTITLFDAQGSLVRSWSGLMSNGDGVELDLSDCAPGIHQLVITHREGRSAHRVLVDR